MSPRCKRAEELDIDNCHEEYDEDGEEEYCLFHKPKKTNLEATRFYDKLVNLRKKIPKQEKDDDQQNLRYKFESLDCRGYIFPDIPHGRKPIFRYVKFDGIVFFDHAIFEQRAIFSYSIFMSRAIFKKTTFEKGAVFRNTEFRSDAEFQGSIFNDGRSFGKEEIKICLILSDSIFEENVNFEGSKFDESVLSRRVTFGKYAIFQDSYFGEKAFFEGSDFGIVPTFVNTNFESSSAKEICYRIQKKKAEEKGNKEKTDSAFVKEMRARREQSNVVSRFFEWLIADFTCQYGTDWKRVLDIAALIIFGYAFVYWIVSGLTGAGIMFSDGGSISSLTALDLWNSIHFSAVTFTTLGFGDMYPQGILELASDLEAITGAILMALLVAVFARKWMR